MNDICIFMTAVEENTLIFIAMKLSTHYNRLLLQLAKPPTRSCKNVSLRIHKQADRAQFHHFILLINSSTRQSLTIFFLLFLPPLSSPIIFDTRTRMRAHVYFTAYLNDHFLHSQPLFPPSPPIFLHLWKPLLSLVLVFLNK